jgi:hypothetical protein
LRRTAAQHSRFRQLGVEVDYGGHRFLPSLGCLDSTYSDMF